MRVNVRLFAAAREQVGDEQLQIELRNDATVADLRQALAEQHPALQTLLPHVLFAIDQRYAKDDTPLLDHCEVACIPPVSGG